jgi:hypothetical protein
MLREDKGLILFQFKPALMLDVENGLTLCEKFHKLRFTNVAGELRCNPTPTIESAICGIQI